MPKRQNTSAAESAVQVRFEADGKRVAADVGMSVLEVAEKGGQPIEAGCRMGVCGADPIAILDGMSCLSTAEEDELNTLRRLGLGKSTRMACCARIKSGSVTVSLTPEPGDGGGAKPTRYDRSIVSVVVLGNGIAGVTAADFIRRGHPDCEIHIVGRESHAAVQPDGHLAAGVRPLRNARPLPAARAMVDDSVTRGSTRWPPGSICVGDACNSASATRCPSTA